MSATADPAQPAASPAGFYACPVCGAPEVAGRPIEGRDRMQGIPGRFVVVACARCGAGRTLPHVAPEDLGALYTETYHAHTLQRGGAFRVAWQAGQRLRWARELRSWPLAALADDGPGAALDIGCGRGDLGAALIRRGWEVSGIEPSPDAVAIARSRGIDAHVGTPGAVELPRGAFDAVTLLHALEHVPDPVDTLAVALGLLRPGGRLIAIVPNFGSWARRRAGARWYHLDLPRHRTHFTAGSLRLAAERAGLTAIDVRDASDPGAFLGTLQYRVFDRIVLGSGWGSAVWSASAALLAPLTAALDRAAGERDFLCLVAARPADA